MAGHTARYTAAQALLRLDGGAYSNLAFDALCQKSGLDRRDGAFARALFYTALERLLTIDHILVGICSRPLDAISPRARCALRLGVAQLAFMDGVEEHAAVSESVNLVRELGSAQAASFVNAALRSFVRGGSRFVIPDGPLDQRMSIEYSCPQWLVRVWLDSYGEQAARRILAGSLGRPPLFLRVNSLRTTAAELAERLVAEGVDAVAEPLPDGCVRVSGALPVEKLDAFKQGLFHVQDKASQMCALALEAHPGERVLDLCAAPGGKSFTIAGQMQNQGELYAFDLHDKRARMVAEGARRLGITILRAGAGDAGVFDEKLGLFDRILCDVPCSGFGVIRRKPEIKYKPRESVANLPEVQYKILKNATQYLKQGGRLVYSTCTLLPEENERVVERALHELPGLRIVDLRTHMGEEFDGDGFFVARFERMK